MKPYLRQVVIALGLSLCALLIFLWVRDAQVRKKTQALRQEVQDKSEALQKLQATAQQNETELQRLDTLKISLREQVQSNEVQIRSLLQALNRATNATDLVRNQTQAYKDALQKANDNIRQQNEEIKAQNERLREVTDTHNLVVSNYNRLAADYKDLVERWNRQQAKLADLAAVANAAATNNARAEKR